MGSSKKLPFIKVYDGYGYSGNIMIYGHVFKRSPHQLSRLTSDGIWSNMWQLIKLFKVKTMPNAKLDVVFEEQHISTTTASDGFFKLEITPEKHLAAGWHSIQVNLLGDDGQ